MSNKHKNMQKKWHEDWIARDWKSNRKGNYYYVTSSKMNLYWKGVKLGKEWQHEEIWNT